MRILVMSDCHGSTRALETVLNRHEDIKKVFYLGDGVAQLDSVKQFYPEREFNAVSGNCDWDTRYPALAVATVEGVKILYTHGHRLGVKYSTEHIYKTALENGAGLALYGHTHVSKLEYRDGIYIVNPGALRNSRDGFESYAIIDITSKGIMPSVMRLNV